MDPIILPRISDQKPLVSVVSITYNHEPYIRDCLEGFLMQKTNFPVEVIIHDDASTDHTAEIIREYYEKRPDLFHVIIERENQYSQHKPFLAPLFEMAQGKYIAICEGDDYWIDPLKLQKQFVFMETNQDYSLFFHNALKKDERRKKEKIMYLRDINCSLSDIIKGGGGLVPTGSMFFLREMIKGYSDFKKGCPVGDYPLAIFLALKGKVIYNGTPMSVYRTGIPNSWSSNHNNNRQKGSDSFRKMVSWLDGIEKIVQSHDAINYSKGFCTLTSLELAGRYDLIKRNELARNYIQKQKIAIRIKYFLECNIPFIVKIKERLRKR